MKKHVASVRAKDIDIRKSSRGNYPLTTCEISSAGADAYEKYVDAIEEYFKLFKGKKAE